MAVGVSGYSDLKHLNYYRLEGATSVLWQIWCRYCRAVVIQSALGCTTASGKYVAPVEQDWRVVSFIAKHQRSGNPPRAKRPLIGLYLEPTWGDIDKLVDIIRAIHPGNRSTLLLAFGSVSHVKHLQAIRNGAAHRNNERLAEVMQYVSLYAGFRVWHPLQALFWKEPSSQQYLVRHVISQMRIAGVVAASS